MGEKGQSNVDSNADDNDNKGSDVNQKEAGESDHDASKKVVNERICPKHMKARCINEYIIIIVIS